MKILKFYTETCGPCRLMAAIVQKVSTEYEVELESIDASQDERASQYKITAVPTFVLVSEEGELDRKTGVVPYPQFKDWVDEYR
tara:strand:- start:106043 stop:106294 length:252 start_codon:yes stop_codon:yes gene_type:complete